MWQRNFSIPILTTLTVFSLALVASGQSQTAVSIDGSSTVYPITKAVAEDFAKTQKPQSKFEVAFSGTGGGFKKFCAGQIDINNASRPISTKEIEACRQAGVSYSELPVAFDALTVVVNPKNTWAADITVAELKKLWEPAAQGKITRWSQVRSGWPDRPIKLYGPGKDSGTYDYFTEAIAGKSGASRTDFTASEDDDELVKGVAKDPEALGYFGYAYYEANRNQLKVLPVTGPKGAPVAPSRATVENNQYQPLSRPLFIYVNVKSAQAKPDLRNFVDHYFKYGGKLVAGTGYIPLPDTGYQVAAGNFARGKVGTVFGGKNSVNLTLQELLSKEATPTPGSNE